MKIESAYNNLYGRFNGNKKDTAIEFGKNGWNKRKCTWVDYEIENTWSDLIIEGDEPECLLNGYIDDTESHLDEIIQIISRLSSKWSFEIYNSQNKLIKKVESKRG